MSHTVKIARHRLVHWHGKKIVTRSYDSKMTSDRLASRKAQGLTGYGTVRAGATGRV